MKTMGTYQAFVNAACLETNHIFGLAMVFNSAFDLSDSLHKLNNGKMKEEEIYNKNEKSKRQTKWDIKKGVVDEEDKGVV